MPDIIKGTKRKLPVSGAGAYVDYGGSGTPSVPLVSFFKRSAVCKRVCKIAG